MRPPIEEERKLASYPDRGIKPILCLMMSTGIRLGAFGTIQWKHIVQIIVKTVMKSITPMTPESYNAILSWMSYCASYGWQMNVL